MSLALPEFTVRDVIDAAIGMMVDPAAPGYDPRIVDDMLASRPQAERDSFRTALADRAGKVRLGWSQDVPEDWCVTVLMTGTQPQHTIGDIAGGLTEEVLALREIAADVSADPNAVVTFTSGVPDDVPARGVLRIGDELATYVIANGVCRLEARGIRETASAAHAADAEVRFYEYVQRIGWPEWVTLRVDVLGSNAAWMMMLARMLQAFVVHARDLFEAEGFTLQDVTAGDLQPRSAMWPAHWFARTLTLRLYTALSLPDVVPPITKVPFTPIVEGTEVHIAAA